MASNEASLLLRIRTAGEKALARVREGLNKLGKVAAVGFAAATAAAVKGISAYKTQELAINKLNQSLIQQGIFTKGLSKSYQDMASELQGVTTFGDEAIIASQSQLQAFIGQEKITKELMQATLDFASAQGTDLATASRLVGQTIGSQTNALARYGIEIDTAGSKSDKLAQVTAALKGQFGGQAEAAAKGLGGLEQLSNAAGDLFEVIGEALAPAVGFFARKLTELVVKLQKNTTLINAMRGAVAFLSESFIGLKTTFKIIFEFLLTSTRLLVTTFDNLISGEWSRIWDDSARIAQEGGENIKKAIADGAKEMSELDAALSEQEKEKEQAKTDAQREEQAKRNLALQQQLEERKALEKDYAAFKGKIGKTMAKGIAALSTKEVQEARTNLGQLSTMQNSKHKELAAVGKLSAISSITMDTAKSAMSAMAFGTKVAGPALGFPLAAMVVAYGIEQSARTAGVKFAEGGIVPATPGGVPAIIGEGGKDEAVIPLNDSGGIGTSFNITVQGGFLGTPTQAREWAKKLDEEMFRLRKSNESLAFDEGVI
jgi:hypothetical protein